MCKENRGLRLTTTGLGRESSANVWGSVVSCQFLRISKPFLTKYTTASRRVELSAGCLGLSRLFCRGPRDCFTYRTRGTWPMS
jgi:hypothetical protein